MPVDKKKTIEAKRKARAEAARNVRLDPVFPYTARPFEPAFFSLTLTPKKASGGTSIR